MKKLILAFVLVSLLTISMYAQTPIRDIQYTEDASGDSPLKGQVVTVTGIVTVEHRGSVAANGGISGSYFFLQDSAAAWSGIQVYYSDSTAAEGDMVTITGTVDEYYNQTQIGNVTEFIRQSSRNPLPGPVEVTTAEANSEPYEGCLVKVNDVTITETGIGNYGEWRVDDGSGAVKIDTRAKYYYTPVLNEPVKSITGVVLFGYGEYSIAPRLAYDIVEAGKFTRIQRIQQVRNSDLVRAYYDTYSDSSYFGFDNGDTCSIRGVVTMPTGLSYAGAGIKFIVSEIGGGPWSAILSYNSDSTAYPVLLEGDLIEMTGYIGEYRTDVSNMTEFWITSPIEIIDFEQPVPDPEFVNTGDLRVPLTAEQWGNVLVYLKDAKITNNRPGFELFAVDDGTGSVLVDDDSDSLEFYSDPDNRPPVGTIADSIRGWVYHHYGSYTDSTAYKVEPLYMSDIVWGAGPPAVSKVKRHITVPTSSDPVTVTADIATNLEIEEAAIYYSASSNNALNKANPVYEKAVMSLVEGTTYQGEIPALPNNSFVNYFVMATDNKEQSTTSPPDTSVQNLCYVVKDGDLSIKDIQYTPWEMAVSPFEGFDVAVSGVVTVDTSAANKYNAYSIQDVESPWSGIFVFGIDAVLNRGDEIKVYGTVTDFNPDWHFKWDNNTVILADSFEVLSSANTINPIDVQTGNIPKTGITAEPYEGVVVRIKNATLTKINQYDVSFDDGSGECLVDGDFLVPADQDPNDIFYFNAQRNPFLAAFGDTLRIGDQVDMIQGVFTYSFGTNKIEIRDANDFGTSVGVNTDFEPVPLTYKLDQNFPNPFNPETRIYFEIPQTHDVKLMIYNVLGQKVRTLAQEKFNTGFHVLNWDGRTDTGELAPTGVYIYRIKAGSFIDSKKMLLLK